MIVPRESVELVALEPSKLLHTLSPLTLSPLGIRLELGESVVQLLKQAGKEDASHGTLYLLWCVFLHLLPCRFGSIQGQDLEAWNASSQEQDV